MTNASLVESNQASIGPCMGDSIPEYLVRLTEPGFGNGIERHPNQIKISKFVLSFGLSDKKRVLMRDLISYLRAAKTGGLSLGREFTRHESRVKVSKWKFTVSQISKVVNFVYDEL